MWFEGGRESVAAIELVGILRRATIDGLASGPQIAGQIEQAIAAARSGDARAIADAERMMSAALVIYVQTLRAPTPGMIYGEPGLPARAPQASIILRDAAAAASLASYLTSVAQVNPTYAALRKAAVAEAGNDGASALAGHPRKPGAGARDPRQGALRAGRCGRGAPVDV